MKRRALSNVSDRLDLPQIGLDQNPYQLAVLRHVCGEVRARRGEIGESAIAAIFPLDILADLVSIGTLMAFISVCVAIMILRLSAPNRTRKFRTPYVWLVAPAGIITCGIMMFSLSLGTWVRLVVWTGLGFLIYFSYGIRHAAPSKWSVSDES